jgi:putative nucleotidyltransferase with HDIG domain
MRTGRQEPYEHLVLRPDGTTVPVETRGRPMEISGRQLRVTAIRDITDRQQRELEMETISALSAALRSAGTLAQMQASILDQILNLLHGDAATVEIVDPASGDAVVELGHGVWQGMVGQRIPRGAGLNSYILSSGKPYLNNDVTSDPKIIDPALYSGYRAAAGVAMTAQGQVIGFLWLGRRTDISGGEVRLLAAIADIAANAMRRATLHEQTERRAHQLAALHDIDIAISSSLDLNLILNILLGHVTTQLQVHAAIVLIFNPKTQTLDYGAGRGLRDTGLGRFRLRLGESQAGRAALERRLIALPDVSDVREIFTHPEMLAGEDIHAYFAVPLVAKGRVIGVLEILHRAPLSPDPEWVNFLTALAGQAAIAIENATLFDDLQRFNVELTLAYEATIEGWSHALDLRDRETEGHTQRVAEMALRLAQAMGIEAEDLVNIRRGALLHDIGKMGVPDHILLKPGPLTGEEWVILRRHPELARQLLLPIEFLRPALDIPYCHHEKWDGSGYPRGLKGDAIPLSARIFAVVDVWDALRSDRPYRLGWPEAEVRNHILAASGSHFDPQVVVAFLGLLASQ